MNKKQYFLLSEKDITEGIERGVFITEDVGLVRDKEGQIVKHIKKLDIKHPKIPPTLIQINNNTIYQADLEPIINLIIETKNSELFDDLSEEYQIVLDCLEYYQNHNDRLQELNSKALNSSSIFEIRTQRYLENIDASNPSSVDNDKCFNMLDSYINILFVYMISAYWLHREKISSDKTALRKLERLELKVKEIYKILLIAGEINSSSLWKSIYMYLFLEGGKDIHLIDSFIKHDSRCKSALDFFESFRDECIVGKSEFTNNEFLISGPRRGEHIKRRLELAKKFYEVLEKIAGLKNIFSELIEAGCIDLGEVKAHENKNNKTLQLTTIPLALHSGSGTDPL